MIIKALKKALAIVLTVMLVVPSLGLTAIVSNATSATTETVTAGELVAQNYASLSDAEKALLTSGYVIGDSYTYSVPENSDDLVSVDTDTKTITADTTVYAKWLRYRFVDFFAGGGSGSAYALRVRTGDRLVLPMVFDGDPRPFHAFMRYDGEEPADWRCTRL